LDNIVKRAASAIWRRIDPSDKGRVWRIMKHPPAVKEDHIVFASSSDYSGNPKALFLYMIENGYNERYHITWMFEKPENYFEFDIPNVSSEIIWNSKGIRRPAAQKAAMSAKYIFYSHNVNWIRKYSDDQLLINLWHGCGYKADMKSDKRKIRYNYMMVTGKKYIDIFRKVQDWPGGIILDLGYPRNEMLFSEKSDARLLLERMKKEAGADRAVIWMPTYRKSVFERLDSDTLPGETGLPILYTVDDVKSFDEYCRSKGVLVILKQHFLQKDYEISSSECKNFVCIDEDYLRENNADFYEFMGATDALITDYSSVAIDYMLLDRPIGYTLDDFNQYEDARGWSFDNVLDYMPGHHIYSIDDIEVFITDTADGRDPYRGRREEILPEIQTYTEGYSKRILEYFGI
jgi:CDP-glycerol glycerophosphotransferase (TagB/SpsB family)